MGNRAAAVERTAAAAPPLTGALLRRGASGAEGLRATVDWLSSFFTPGTRLHRVRPPHVSGES